MSKEGFRTDERSSGAVASPIKQEPSSSDEELLSGPTFEVLGNVLFDSASQRYNPTGTILEGKQLKYIATDGITYEIDSSSLTLDYCKTHLISGSVYFEEHIGKRTIRQQVNLLAIRELEIYVGAAVVVGEETVASPINEDGAKTNNKSAEGVGEFVFSVAEDERSPLLPRPRIPGLRRLTGCFSSIWNNRCVNNPVTRMFTGAAVTTATIYSVLGFSVMLDETAGANALDYLDAGYCVTMDAIGMAALMLSDAGLRRWLQEPLMLTAVYTASHGLFELCGAAGQCCGAGCASLIDFGTKRPRKGLV